MSPASTARDRATPTRSTTSSRREPSPACRSPPEPSSLANVPSLVNRNQIDESVRALGWYHSIDLGDGIVTPGRSESVPLTAGQLPDMRDRTVLDIGAWDGYYSFLAERCGASRVVALDHYAWGVDMGRREEYWAECAA